MQINAMSYDQELILTLAIINCKQFMHGNTSYEMQKILVATEQNLLCDSGVVFAHMHAL